MRAGARLCPGAGGSSRPFVRAGCEGSPGWRRRPSLASARCCRQRRCCSSRNRWQAAASFSCCSGWRGWLPSKPPGRGHLQAEGFSPSPRRWEVQLSCPACCLFSQLSAGSRTSTGEDPPPPTSFRWMSDPKYAL